MQNKRLLDSGRTAQVYEYEPGKVCKLFCEGYPEDYVRLEFSNAIELYRCNIRVPRPFEIGTFDNRIGIVYEKINGKTLFCLMNEHEDKRDSLLNIFAAQHAHLLSHKANNILLSYKEFLTAMIANKTDAGQSVIERINSLPDGARVLHGDFHPNNIMIAEDDTPIIIDCMNVCYGPALYDIARTHFLIKQYDSPMAEEYLIKMNVTESAILKYENVIELCREFE